MQIRYSSRSKFLADFESFIRDNRDDLIDGKLLKCTLESGGYAGSITVTISSHTADTFDTDWEYSDPTRFPARIKALATALKQKSCHGTFRVSHNDGAITIVRQ